MLGSPADSQYTWDLSKNDNKGITGFKGRYRFDRLFVCYRPSDVNCTKYWWTPQEMSLVGNEKIDSCGMFPSDHFGIYLKLQRTNEERKIDIKVEEEASRKRRR